jgi:hypothetical protein
MPPKFPKFIVRGLKSWDKEKLAIQKETKRIGSKLVPVHGGGPTRIFPSQTAKHDENHGFRIDRGVQVHGDPNKMKVILQINREAKDPALKDIMKKAKRGTHTKIAEAIIDTTKPEKEKVDDMVSQFDEYMSGRGRKEK